MPTNKPRLSITLEPSQYGVLQRLAKLQDRPTSAVLTEFVSAAFPTLERLADALEVAQRASADIRVNLASNLEKAENELQPVIKAVLNQLSLFTEGVTGEASAGGSRAAAPASPLLTGGAEFKKRGGKSSSVHHLGESDAL